MFNYVEYLLITIIRFSDIIRVGSTRPTFPEDLIPFIRQKNIIVQASRRESTRCHLNSDVPSLMSAEISRTTRLGMQLRYICKCNGRGLSTFWVGCVDGGYARVGYIRVANVYELVVYG